MMRIGIIGNGKMGRIHEHAYQLLGLDPLVADVKPGYLNPSELLKQVDAVSICTPSETHAELVIEALRHHVSVLVEKPLCMNMIEAEKVQEAKEKSTGLIAVGYCERFTPGIEAVAPAKAYHTFRLAPESKRDPLTDTACHDIDLILYLTKPKQVWIEPGTVEKRSNWIKFNWRVDGIPVCSTAGEGPYRREIIGSKTLTLNNRTNVDSEVACFVKSVKNGCLKKPLCTLKEAVKVQSVIHMVSRNGNIDDYIDPTGTFVKML